MRTELPLLVHGLISPFLSWVESSGNAGLPIYWTHRAGAHDREHSWLMNELPTYSLDSLDEVIAVNRQRDGIEHGPERRVPLIDRAAPAMDPPVGFSVVEAMRRLAQRYFQWVGPELCIREGRVVELHELGVRFPIRHVIRLAHADACAQGHLTPERALELPDKVDDLHTVYSGLRTEVEKGVVEGHLHLNSILSAAESWAAMIASGVMPTSYLGHPAPGASRLTRLGRSAARLMAISICHLLSDSPPSQSWYSDAFRTLLLLDRLYWQRSGQRRWELAKSIDRALCDVGQSARLALVDKRHPWLQRESDWLLPLVAPSLVSVERSGSRGSPRFMGIRAQIRAVNRLHFYVLEWLVRHSPSSDRSAKTAALPGSFAPMWSLLHQLLFRYLIYHAHHWQQAVRHGRTTGVRYFQNFYRSGFRQSVSDRVEANAFAFERMVRDRPLRAVEGRLAPPVRRTSYMPWILSFIDSHRKGRLERCGIVVHFLKQPAGPPTRRRARPQILPGVRHGRTRHYLRRQVFRFFRKLSSPDPVVAFIVGFDAASQELSAPPEVFAPAFRFIREYPVEVRHRDTATQGFGSHNALFDELQGRRLGMTYHVGEEFRHVLSGLRAIHETIEFLKPRPGDRLGHGTALALDPEVWAKHCGYQAVLPKQEWLDTLVWVHHVLGAGHDLIGLLSLEDRVQKLCHDIYERDANVPIATLKDAWRLRQLDPYYLNVTALTEGRLDFRKRLGNGLQHKRWADVQELVWREVRGEMGSRQAYRLAADYWFEARVRKRGDALIAISLWQQRGLWTRVCREVQERLQTTVRDRELVIEVNPSSNRFVGPMSSLGEHHVFALTLDPSKERLRRLFRVTINTDNPGVFSTSLAHEYYMLAEERLQAGMAEAEVVDWLAWLRENSRDYSFLRHMSDPDSPGMQRLLDDLEERYLPLRRRMEGRRRRMPRCIEDYQEAMRLRPHLNEKVFRKHRTSPRTLRRMLREAGGRSNL